VIRCMHDLERALCAARGDSDAQLRALQHATAATTEAIALALAALRRGDVAHATVLLARWEDGHATP
jgi:hypothetical protein